MDPSHPERILPIMAWPNNRSCTQTPTKVCRHNWIKQGKTHDPPKPTNPLLTIKPQTKYNKNPTTTKPTLSMLPSKHREKYTLTKPVDFPLHPVAEINTSW
jgi:hypothetical protein